MQLFPPGERVKLKWTVSEPIKEGSPEEVEFREDMMAQICNGANPINAFTAAGGSIDAIFLVRGKTVVAIAVLGAAFIGVFTLLTTALSTAFISGGLLLGPGLAGVLVLTTRYLGRRQSTSPTKHMVQNK